MIDATDPGAAVPSAILQGLEMGGDLNTPLDTILAQIAHAIRQGHPQVRPEGLKVDRICLVGGGPSLESTLPELRDLYFAGAKLVTVNGAYRWCLEHHLRPSGQVVLDARPSTVRFLSPPVPRCMYFLASQCHADVWALLRDRPQTFIWHSMNPDNPEGALLDDYYGAGRWHGILGGTTVASRALGLLRMIGYLRFDLFGVDCCWQDYAHHAYPQIENARDRRIAVRLGASADAETPTRTFYCAPWHLKALEDWLLLIKHYGDHFALSVHGDGLLAHALQTGAAALPTDDVIVKE